MKYLILLVALVALVRSQTSSLACPQRTEGSCKEVPNSCRWCPGLGCAPLPLSTDADPCQYFVKPTIISPAPQSNDCSSRLTKDVCASPSTNANSVPCLWCGEKCVASAVVNGACPLEIGPCIGVTDQTKCLSITGSASGVAVCRWCDTFGCLATGRDCPTPAVKCEQCDLTTKPYLLCVDGSELQSECDKTTCTWAPVNKDTCTANSNCPKGCGATTQEVTFCADGSVATKFCNLKTCAWQPKSCQDCNNCANVAMPLDLANAALLSCADGSTAGPYCDESDCTYKYRPCKIVDPPPTIVCPKDVTPVNCFVRPCSFSKCDDPLAVKCEDNYCGGCNAVWYREGGVKAECGSSPVTCDSSLACFSAPCSFSKCNDPLAVKCENDYCNGCNALWYRADGTKAECVAPIDCSNQANCPAVKPTITDKCSNPKFYCAATADQKCDWSFLCPEDTTCDCTKLAHPTVILPCENGGTGKYVCNPVGLPFTKTDIGVDTTTSTDSTEDRVTSCGWGYQCPPTTSSTDCTVGGVCGDQCVPTSKVSPDLTTFAVTECKKTTPTCVDICHQTYATQDSCGLKSDGSCRFSFSNPEAYSYCVKKCLAVGTPVPEDPCTGDVCSCDYTQCGWCRRNYTATTDSKAVISTIKEGCQRLSSTCSSDSASVATLMATRPDKCFASTAGNTPDNQPQIVKDVKDNLDPVKIQQQLGEQANTVVAVKNHIITFGDIGAVSGDSSVVDVKVIVKTSGDSTPSSSEQDSICRAVTLPAVQKVLDAANTKVNLVLKSCEKIVNPDATTNKRGAQQTASNSYIVSMTGSGSAPNPTGSNPTGSNPTGPNSAASIFISLAALLLATLALLF